MPSTAAGATGRLWWGEEKAVWRDPSNHFQKEVLGCLIGCFSKSYWTWFGIRSIFNEMFVCIVWWLYDEDDGFPNIVSPRHWLDWADFESFQCRQLPENWNAVEFSCLTTERCYHWWMDSLSWHCHPTYSSNDTLCHMNTARNLFMKACYLHKWYIYSTWDICGLPDSFRSNSQTKAADREKKHRKSRWILRGKTKLLGLFVSNCN